MKKIEDVQQSHRISVYINKKVNIQVLVIGDLVFCLSNGRDKKYIIKMKISYINQVMECINSNLIRCSFIEIANESYPIRI